MKRQLATTVETPEVSRLLPEDRFFKRIADLHQIIARRAYELFRARGFIDGHDLDDWLQAESEIVKPVPLEISETEDAITVRSVLLGYRAEDMEIHVEPKRLFINGQRQQNWEEKKREAVRSAESIELRFRTVDLPVQIDPNKVRATLSDGELQIELAKVKTSERVAAAKAAA
jgi:HSP20 family protein